MVVRVFNTRQDGTVAQTNLLQQVRQMTKTRSVFRFQREFTRIRGAVSDFFYLFFL